MKGVKKKLNQCICSKLFLGFCYSGFGHVEAFLQSLLMSVFKSERHCVDDFLERLVWLSQFLANNVGVDVLRFVRVRSHEETIIDLYCEVFWIKLVMLLPFI